ncbi:MAG: outer membrane beta-barrel protein [Pseudomonadota bacterium]
MMRALCLFGLMLLASSAWSQEPPPWYVGAHLGVASVDDDAGRADDATALRFNLGRQLDSSLTLEFEAGLGEVSFDEGPDLDQTHAAINVVLVNRSARWNPYFLVGVGAFDHDGADFNDTGAMAQAALGGMWDLNGFGMMLKADLRYRYSDLDRDVIDRGQALFTIGIELPFGSR